MPLISSFSVQFALFFMYNIFISSFSVQYALFFLLGDVHQKKCAWFGWAVPTPEPWTVRYKTDSKNWNRESPIGSMDTPENWTAGSVRFLGGSMEPVSTSFFGQIKKKFVYQHRINKTKGKEHNISYNSYTMIDYINHIIHKSSGYPLIIGKNDQGIPTI